MRIETTMTIKICPNKRVNVKSYIDGFFVNYYFINDCSLTEYSHVHKVTTLNL